MTEQTQLPGGARILEVWPLACLAVAQNVFVVATTSVGQWHFFVQRKLFGIFGCQSSQWRARERVRRRVIVLEDSFLRRCVQSSTPEWLVVQTIHTISGRHSLPESCFAINPSSRPVLLFGTRELRHKWHASEQTPVKTADKLLRRVTVPVILIFFFLGKNCL